MIYDLILLQKWLFLYNAIVKVVINELNTLQKWKKNQNFLDKEKESELNNVNIETIPLYYYNEWLFFKSFCIWKMKIKIISKIQKTIKRICNSNVLII